jgi:carboxymethylenebutenolidase
MQAAGKKYEPLINPGAGHAFMRLGEAADATPDNRKAREEAWTRIKAILGKLP